MISKNRPFYDIKEIASLVLKGAVEDYERAFAEIAGRKYALSFPYGRSALFAILKALGIGGKEVIIPAYTCIVVPNAIVYSDNKPVFVDISLSDLNMRIDEVEKEITELTKAIVVTHMYGYPLRCNGLKEKSGGALIIEDCALSLPSASDSFVGTQGDIAFFSSGINKHISTVEGGMVTTERPDIYEKLKNYRDAAFAKPSVMNVCSRIGRFFLSYVFFNEFVYYFMQHISRLPSARLLRESRRLDRIDMPKDFLTAFTNVQARIGMVQLDKIGEILRKRKGLVKYYNSELKGLDGLILPPEIPGATYSHYALMVAGRDNIDFRNKMRKKGVEVGRTIDYYIPDFDFYKKYAKRTYQNSLTASLQIANLPNYPSLSLQKASYIVKCVKEILKEV